MRSKNKKFFRHSNFPHVINTVHSLGLNWSHSIVFPQLCFLAAHCSTNFHFNSTSISKIRKIESCAYFRKCSSQWLCVPQWPSSWHCKTIPMWFFWWAPGFEWSLLFRRYSWTGDSETKTFFHLHLRSGISAWKKKNIREQLYATNTFARPKLAKLNCSTFAIVFLHFLRKNYLKIYKFRMKRSSGDFRKCFFSLTCMTLPHSPITLRKYPNLFFIFSEGFRNLSFPLFVLTLKFTVVKSWKFPNKSWVRFNYHHWRAPLDFCARIASSKTFLGCRHIGKNLKSKFWV